MERFKARLVARGFSQRPGEDYDLTFAPVMGLPTFRILLAMACTWDVAAYHGDIPNAYVRAKLKEEIFMDVPDGMEVPREHRGSADVKLRLLRSHYGLKQSGREWNELLNSKLEELGFVA